MSWNIQLFLSFHTVHIKQRGFFWMSYFYFLTLFILLYEKCWLPAFHSSNHPMPMCCLYLQHPITWLLHRFLDYSIVFLLGLVGWCCMCKQSGNSIDHRLLHCSYVVLWSLVFCLFGLCLWAFWRCWSVGKGV